MKTFDSFIKEASKATDVEIVTPFGNNADNSLVGLYMYYRLIKEIHELTIEVKSMNDTIHEKK